MLDRTKYFHEVLWPHVRGAHNFARWLVRNDQDAEDIVQESFVKAFRSLDTFRGGDPRVWLLTIVRNTAMNLLRRRETERIARLSDRPEPADSKPNPESAMIEDNRRRQVRAAIQELPQEFQETLILREIEGLSYKELRFSTCRSAR